jgi:signal transduction histidine kinase
MNSGRTKTIISIAIVIILCLLLSTLFYSIYSIRKMFENLQVQVDTRTIIITLKDNMSILLNAETGERGYVITGNKNYLGPYNMAQQRLAENTAWLDSALGAGENSRKEMDSLKSYVNLKMAYIGKIVQLKADGDEQSVREMLNTNLGKDYMDKVREQNEKLQAIEKDFFQKRKSVTDTSIRRTRMVFLADGIFSILIVLFLASVIIKEFNRRSRNEKMLKENAVDLERKNREIEQFAFVASHDLQQPLRSISNFTGLLEQKIGGNVDMETIQYMNFIKGGATRMSALITDLLEYSRVGKDVKPEKIDCSAVVNEVISDMDAIITETGAQVNVGSLPIITGYGYLRSVFRNLLSNALKFIQKDIRPVVNITAKDLGKEYLFTIEDNGIGIESAYMERIFIIFQRLHTRSDYPGTGIGLSICKKIVELHGGKIWADSEQGKGSSFHFTISKHLS